MYILNHAIKNSHLLFQVIENVNQNHRQEHLNEKELMRHRPQHWEYFQRSVCMQTKSKSNKEKDLLFVYNYRK